LAAELNQDNYEGEVLESKEPLLADFLGLQCRPYLALMPTVERLEKDYASRLKVTNLNARQNRLLCAKVQVVSLTTYLCHGLKT